MANVSGSSSAASPRGSGAEGSDPFAGHKRAFEGRSVEAPGKENGPSRNISSPEPRVKARRTGSYPSTPSTPEPKSLSQRATRHSSNQPAEELPSTVPVRDSDDFTPTVPAEGSGSSQFAPTQPVGSQAAPQLALRRRSVAHSQSQSARVREMRARVAALDQFHQQQRAALAQRHAEAERQEAAQRADKMRQLQETYAPIKTYIQEQAAQSPFNDHAIAFDENGKPLRSRIGKGITGEVHAYKFKIDDKEKWLVFKPEPEARRTTTPRKRRIGGFTRSGAHAGITFDTQTATARSIGSFRLNQLLGFDVIPFTEFAQVGGRAGSVMAYIDAKRGYEFKVQEKNLSQEAPTDREKEALEYIKRFGSSEEILSAAAAQIGASIITQSKETGDIIRIDTRPSSPLFRQEMIRLQLMDSLTGQVDRHPQNYLVETDRAGEVIGIKGIDNDVAFGPNMPSLSAIRGIQDQPDYFNKTIYLRKLPKVVDEATARVFLNLTEGQVSETLQNLITDPELQKTLERLEEIQTHLKQLQKQGRIIPEGIENYANGKTTPSGESVTDLIMDTETSYVGRDHKRLPKCLQYRHQNPGKFPYNKMLGPETPEKPKQ